MVGDLPKLPKKGIVKVPEEVAGVMEKFAAGEKLTEAENRIMARHRWKYVFCAARQN